MIEWLGVAFAVCAMALPLMVVGEILRNHNRAKILSSTMQSYASAGVVLTS